MECLYEGLNLHAFLAHAGDEFEIQNKGQEPIALRQAETDRSNLTYDRGTYR